MENELAFLERRVAMSKKIPLLRTTILGVSEDPNGFVCIGCGDGYKTGTRFTPGFTIRSTEQDHLLGNEVSMCADCLPRFMSCIGYFLGFQEGYWTDNSLTEDDLHVAYLRGVSEGKSSRVDMFEAMYDRVIDQLSGAKKENTKLLDLLEKTKPTEGNQGFVYLMIREDGCHKIGLSNDPERRLKQIQREHPSSKLIHTIKVDDMREAELRLHKQYSEWRKDGEWFELDRSQVEDICRLLRYDDGNFLVKEALLNKGEAHF